MIPLCTTVGAVADCVLTKSAVGPVLGLLMNDTVSRQHADTGLAYVSELLPTHRTHRQSESLLAAETKVTCASNPAEGKGLLSQAQ